MPGAETVILAGRTTMSCAVLRIVRDVTDGDW
jgi:hypothetical protein